MGLTPPPPYYGLCFRNGPRVAAPLTCCGRGDAGFTSGLTGSRKGFFRRVADTESAAIVRPGVNGAEKWAAIEGAFRNTRERRAPRFVSRDGDLLRELSVGRKGGGEALGSSRGRILSLYFKIA